jgi:hypothetical protein
MGFFAKTLKGVAEYLGETDDVAELAKMENAIIKNLDGTAPLDLKVLMGRFTLE